MSNLIEPSKYLTDIGLRQFRNSNQFWAYIDSQYPASAISDLEQAYIQLEQGLESAFYERIYMDFKTSLDFASLRFDLYRDFLQWLLAMLAQESKPETIVDLGCGSGVVACFLALYYPDARVIGTDISENAVACALDLKNHLGLKNIEFIVSDSNKLELPVDEGGVELITSLATMGPLEDELALTAHFPLSILQEKVRALQGPQALAHVFRYLRPRKGVFVSLEKLASIQAQLLWASNLANHGARLSLSRSGWLSYSTVDQDPVSLPVLVAECDTTDNTEPETDSEKLLSFFLQKGEASSSWTSEFGQEALAESIFDRINPKRFHRGAVAVFSDGSGRYCYELWQAGPFYLSFEHTDKGFRCLRIDATCHCDNALSRFDKWKTQAGSYATISDLIESAWTS